MKWLAELFTWATLCFIVWPFLISISPNEWITFILVVIWPMIIGMIVPMWAVTFIKDMKK